MSQSSPNKVFISSYLSTTSNERADRFEIVLPEVVNNATSVHLVRLVLPFTPLHPNVPPEEATFTFTCAAGGPFSVSIDTDQYYPAVSDFVSELQGKINAVCPTLVVSFNATTQRLVFTDGGGGSFPIVPGLVSLPNPNNLINRRLGLTSLTGSTGTAGVLTAECPPIIIRTTCIHLTASINSGDSIGNDGSRVDQFSLIPMSSGIYGTILVLESHLDDAISLITNSSFNQISFQLLDDLLQPLLMCDNTNMSIELHFMYDPNQEVTEAPLSY